MSESRSPRPKRAAALRANERLLEPELLWKAFEKAKPRMCGQAAKKTIEAMEFHRQCPDYESPSKHLFYIRIKGKGRIDDPELYYYPYLLVLQAIWPYSEHVQTIAKAFARYWGVPDMWRGPEHYPMLNDRDREMELFMGLKTRETEAREDKSSAGNGEDNEEDEEDEEDVKQENEEEQEQEQEDEQGEEQDEEQEREQEQQLEGEQNEDDEEQEEQQDEGDEDKIPDIPDIDAITDIEKLDKLESILEVREKKLMYQIQETKERVRKVQERKRDQYRKKSSASKKAAERLQVRLDAERMVSDHWATKEREYIKKLERSSATSSVISPPPEQESERPAKRQRAAGQKEWAVAAANDRECVSQFKFDICKVAKENDAGLVRQQLLPKVLAGFVGGMETTAESVWWKASKKNGVWYATAMMLPSINIKIQFAIVHCNAAGSMVVQ